MLLLVDASSVTSVLGVLSVAVGGVDVTVVLPVLFMFPKKLTNLRFMLYALQIGNSNDLLCQKALTSFSNIKYPLRIHNKNTKIKRVILF